MTISGACSRMAPASPALAVTEFTSTPIRCSARLARRLTLPASPVPPWASLATTALPSMRKVCASSSTVPPRPCACALLLTRLSLRSSSRPAFRNTEPPSPEPLLLALSMPLWPVTRRSRPASIWMAPPCPVPCAAMAEAIRLPVPMSMSCALSSTRPALPALLVELFSTLACRLSSCCAVSVMEPAWPPPSKVALLRLAPDSSMTGASSRIAPASRLPKVLAAISELPSTRRRLSPRRVRSPARLSPKMDEVNRRLASVTVSSPPSSSTLPAWPSASPRLLTPLADTPRLPAACKVTLPACAPAPWALLSTKLPRCSVRSCPCKRKSPVRPDSVVARTSLPSSSRAPALSNCVAPVLPPPSRLAWLTRLSSSSICAACKRSSPVAPLPSVVCVMRLPVSCRRPPADTEVSRPAPLPSSVLSTAAPLLIERSLSLSSVSAPPRPALLATTCT